MLQASRGCTCTHQQAGKGASSQCSITGSICTSSSAWSAGLVDKSSFHIIVRSG
jgi:hypothetical protein